MLTKLLEFLRKESVRNVLWVVGSASLVVVIPKVIVPGFREFVAYLRESPPPRTGYIRLSDPPRSVEVTPTPEPSWSGSVPKPPRPEPRRVPLLDSSDWNDVKANFVIASPKGAVASVFNTSDRPLVIHLCAFGRDEKLIRSTSKLVGAGETTRLSLDDGRDAATYTVAAALSDRERLEYRVPDFRRNLASAFPR